MENWDKEIKKVIKEREKHFDLHDIIKKLAQSNQKKYIRELCNIKGKAPFHILHSFLGKRIKVVCNLLGFISEQSRSADMFGQQSKCLRWSCKS